MCAGDLLFEEFAEEGTGLALGFGGVAGGMAFLAVAGTAHFDEALFTEVVFAMAAHQK